MCHIVHAYFLFWMLFFNLFLHQVKIFWIITGQTNAFFTVHVAWFSWISFGEILKKNFQYTQQDKG